MAVDVTWPVIITTALVDSINPCAIGVLILLISTLLAMSHDKKRMLAVGSIYIAAIYIVYFLAGIGLLLFIQRLNIAQPLSIFVGSLVIILGLIEIKDFFWYGKGISLRISPRYVKYIEKHAKNVTTLSAIILGAFVAAVELPCTGGPYLAITTWIAQSEILPLKALYYLLVYNFIFILPLLIILALVYFGVKVQEIKKWKQEHRRWMRLFIGIILIALGVLLILIAYNVITFSLS
ncbi:MAG TPA: GAP family protein [Candidatus Nanoarchaeia archaeon]|nr:GAP family protein [Candidatus Nanoarchaeia archaeon]